MKARFAILSLALSLTVGSIRTFAAGAPPADPGWPRVFKQDGKQLTVYQPQVDYWHGFTNMHFRCAIAVKGVAKQEKFGVVEMDAVTVVDQSARIVALVPTQRDLRFPNTADPELAALRQTVDRIKPPHQAVTISLDRVLAYLDPAAHPVQPAVELNLDPPRIFYSPSPAILVIFMGQPKFVPVDTNRTDLAFALNTNWDVLRDTANGHFFLLNGNGWLTAPDVLNGPWMPARELPVALFSLPATDNWAEVRKNLPGKPPKTAPTVFVTTEPAEMILTQGTPAYRSISGTALQQVKNTESTLFRHNGDAQFYLLVAGRWFRAGNLSGPWSAASQNLPPDFARIPDSDPAAFVKASVPGTRDAQDAVLLASIPTTTTVTITNVVVDVTYNGQPQFAPIPSTTVQYAINTPNQVFLVNGGYYCCSQGVWFCGANATGPWSFCTSVPPAIYTIPPSNPNYNVTYVVVQSATPTTVTYSQTAGYSGEYVAATGVLMFGAGMLVGAAIANNNNDYYYPPYPCHYSYGCGAVYHYGGGGYYGGGYAYYGPYGGAGRTAAYNPSTGTYARSSYAYGPYGSAARGAAYNPYTGTSAAGRTVSTPYGTASQGAAYNPYTGARAAGGSVSTAYGSAGRGAAYNPTTGQGAAGRYASGEYGSAGAVRTTEGSGMAAWDTQSGQGAVGKTQSGDVYAAKDGTVYKKDSSGGWSQNSGDGWESASKPQSASASAQSTSRQPATSSAQPQRSTTAAPASSTWSQNKPSMESQAQARSWGNQQTQRSQSWSGGGASRGGGGGRRR